MKVRIVNKSKHNLPSYGTMFSAGMDLRADLNEPMVLQPNERALVPTGLFVELPQGFEAQIRPRSGLALKHGITILNTPGTIDSDYRGEVKVLLINHGKEDFIVKFGDRIAQLIISKCEKAELFPSENLSDTKRGSGGYGSTGKN